MIELQIRYAKTSDGLSVAYSIQGNWYPLLWCPNFVESFALVGKKRMEPWQEMKIRR